MGQRAKFSPRTGAPIPLPPGAKAYDENDNEVPLSNVVQGDNGATVKPAGPRKIRFEGNVISVPGDATEDEVKQILGKYTNTGLSGAAQPNPSTFAKDSPNDASKFRRFATRATGVPDDAFDHPNAYMNPFSKDYQNPTGARKQYLDSFSQPPSGSVMPFKQTAQDFKDKNYMGVAGDLAPGALAVATMFGGKGAPETPNVWEGAPPAEIPAGTPPSGPSLLNRTANAVSSAVKSPVGSKVGAFSKVTRGVGRVADTVANMTAPKPVVDTPSLSTSFNEVRGPYKGGDLASENLGTSNTNHPAVDGQAHYNDIPDFPPALKTPVARPDPLWKTAGATKTTPATPDVPAGNDAFTGRNSTGLSDAVDAHIRGGGFKPGGQGRITIHNDSENIMRPEPLSPSKAILPDPATAQLKAELDRIPPSQPTNGLDTNEPWDKILGKDELSHALDTDPYNQTLDQLQPLRRRRGDPDPNPNEAPPSVSGGAFDRPKGLLPPAPEDYFHGTRFRNVPSILREGLDPNKIDPGYLEEEGEPFTFLGEHPDTAKDFAPGGDFNDWPEKGAILRIRAPYSLSKQFRTDLGEFTRSPVRIPPENITLDSTQGPDINTYIGPSDEPIPLPASKRSKVK